MKSKKSRAIALGGILLGAVVYSFSLSAGSSNGFDLSNSSLPPEQIYSGGPPRDGIPAISDPRLIAAGEADYLTPTDRVVGISLGSQARAYPIAILNWHEIVNDEIDGRRLAITYCPLCGTAVAFDATIDGSPTDFGVSGLLYNNDVLLYDRETESLWSQIMSEAISGERVGTKLTMLPLSHTTWRDWLAKHPDTLVLSEDTGYSRDYQRNPYAVLGLGIDGFYKAYPFVELDRQGKSRFSDTINGNRFSFAWDAINRSVTVTDSTGQQVAGIQGFWFAWFAFHPDTEVYKAQGS
jgi:hypothetical protein